MFLRVHYSVFVMLGLSATNTAIMHPFQDYWTVVWKIMATSEPKNQLGLSLDPKVEANKQVIETQNSPSCSFFLPYLNSQSL